MNPRTLMLSWLRNKTRGRSPETFIPIQVLELTELEEQLEGTPKGGKGSRGPRVSKGMTSRSKLRRQPDSERLRFARRHVCCSCRESSCQPVEAHHAGRKRDKGFGRKAPDERAVALGLPCHNYFHQHGHFKGLTVEQTHERIEETIGAYDAEWAERQKDVF